MKPIYEPKGKAKEYGDLALNIYTGCPHKCTYCYAPLVLKKDRQAFHNCCEPRKNIVEETKKQLKRENIIGKEIFLCFTCDPFPYGHDHSTTYEIIKAIKNTGNTVAVLTKGYVDVSTLKQYFDKNDRFGITISCKTSKGSIEESGAFNALGRLSILKEVKKKIGCKTFISCEPVLDTEYIKHLIMTVDYCDEFRIGKLNYVKNDTNWKQFGIECEELCKQYNRNYLIKEGLRVEMNK